MLQGFDIFLIGAIATFLTLIAIVTTVIGIVIRRDERTRVLEPGVLVFALGSLLFAGGFLAIFIVAPPGLSAPTESLVYVAAPLCLVVGAALMIGHLIALTIRQRRTAASQGYPMPPRTLAEYLWPIGAAAVAGGSAASSKLSGNALWIAYAVALLGALLMLAAFLIARRKRARAHAS